MNKNWSKFVVSAMVAGFISSHVALANDAAAPAGDEAKTKENGCGGEKGCSGKCEGKAKGKKAKGKKAKKAKADAHPADAHPAEGHPAEAPAPEAK